jgi:hypothetical protein
VVAVSLELKQLENLEEQKVEPNGLCENEGNNNCRKQYGRL